MTAVIETSGLTKHFGSVAALDGLDLTVTAGEVHGFLGPNGAGKSTTLRILLGLLRADGGAARLFGADPWRDATELHQRIAYVPGDVVLWPNLTGGEIIDLLFHLRGSTHEARRAELLDRFELDPTKKGRAYSKGNRQKVALVAALASDAELLLLDEPTAGLDPLMERVFQEELVRIREEGRTVLLSSHILSEVEKACSRVSIVRDGKIIESGELRELQHLRRTHITATVGDEVTAADLAAIPQLQDADVTTDVRGTVVRGTADPDQVGVVISALQRHGIRSLTCAPPTLEELFLARYTQP
jgi:ABC-2 type transport system ATP-binding protein